MNRVKFQSAVVELKALRQDTASQNPFFQQRLLARTKTLKLHAAPSVQVGLPRANSVRFNYCNCCLLDV